MRIILPFRLTGSGNPGYRYPNSVTIRYSNGSILTNISVITSNMLTSPFRMDISSGYGSNNVRITNIAGYDGTDFLKWCPHCKKIKPLSDFDNIGRYNSSRDQSNCNDCRGSY